MEKALERIQSLGERILELRKNHRWSQDDLATRIGVSRPSVSQWESGDTKNIKNDNLLSLAKAFGITVDELLTGKPPAPGAHHQVAESESRYSNAPDSDLLQSCIKFVEEMLGDLTTTVTPETKAKFVAFVYDTLMPDGSIDVRKVSQLIIKEVGKKDETRRPPRP